MRSLARALATFFCGLIGLSGTAAAQGVALTFDDMPAHNVLPSGTSRVDVARKIILAMKQAGVRKASGFINGVRGEAADTATLSAQIFPLWVASGYSLGSHTWSHPWLSKLSIDDIRIEIEKVDAVLATYASGTDWHWFRYPFLDEASGEKREAIRKILAQKGYRIASVTLNFDDYAFNEAYGRCAAKEDTVAIRELESRFLKAASESLAYERALSLTLYGRTPPLVLLMHLGAFTAHMMPKLLDQYRSQGVSFVSVEEAERDPVYAQDTKLETASEHRISIEMMAVDHHILLPPHADWRASADGMCR